MLLTHGLALQVHPAVRGQPAAAADVDGGIAHRRRRIVDGPARDEGDGAGRQPQAVGVGRDGAEDQQRPRGIPSCRHQRIDPLLPHRRNESGPTAFTITST